MRKLWSQAVFVAIVGLSLLGAGCAQYANLRARMTFREGNAAYQGQNYKEAVDKYEQVIAMNPTDPQLQTSYFFLGNSYDNLYKPGRENDPENDKMLQKAIENYKLAMERIKEVPNIRTLAIQYLVAAYGSDKLNDPSQAEPLLQQLIMEDPMEPANYFILSRLYEDSGDYEAAEQQLLKAKEMKPGDPVVYTTLAAYYDRQGQFDKLIGALEARTQQEPNNPEAYYTIATYYFNKASRDFSLKADDKMKYATAGVAATDKALAINKDYMEALTFKNLLLRLQANLEKNIPRQQALLKQADEIRNRAEELRKLKAAGLAG